MNKTAIILAAGLGSRLFPITKNIPKCCVNVAGESLIHRVIRQLLKVDPKMPIYVVTGYLSDLVEKELNDFEGKVKFLFNKDFQTTNNMESCRIGLESRIDYPASLILNADCVYDDLIVQEMVLVDHSCIATDSSVYNDENMKVLIENNLVKDISKKIVNGENVSTSIDIYSFVKNDLDRLLEIMRDFNHRGELNSWTEVAIAKLTSEADIKVLDVNKKPWMEIDDLKDLEIATKLFT